MGLFFNKLKTEEVYDVFKEKVPAMDAVGFPENRTFCADFALSKDNVCDADVCQFGLRWKYLGKWDIEFIFYFSKKYKELRASVWFHNLSLDKNNNGATDELRNSLKVRFGANYVNLGIDTINYYSYGTQISMKSRKIKSLDDVPKYLFNFREEWKNYKMLEVMTQFKTDEELGKGMHKVVYEDESVEIDGGIDNL